MTDDGRTFEAKAVVNAAGVHSDELNNQVNPVKYNIQPRRGDITDGQVSDGKRAFARLVHRTLVDPQQPHEIGSGALEPAQVVGVIDHARQVGILEIGAHREMVHRAIDQAGGQGGQ